MNKTNSMANNKKRRQEIITLVIVFAGVVLLSASVVYFLSSGSRTTPERAAPETVRPTPSGQQPDAVFGIPDQRTPAASPASAGDTFIDRLFGSRHSEAYIAGDSWLQTMGRISLRFLLAALLGAALAYRPRK